MKLTKYGHAAFLIEDGPAKLLLDPGSFSSGFEDLIGLTGILYTHVHGDHYDEAKLAAVLAGNPEVPILADEDTAAKLQAAGHQVSVAHQGDKLDFGGAKLVIIGSEHAAIHRYMPRAKNVGYLINGRVFYPGDALTPPGQGIEILLLPVEAPWTKVAEVVDYLVDVNPKVALPSHESVSAMPQMQYGMIAGVAKDKGIDWRPLEQGESVEL